MACIPHIQHAGNVGADVVPLDGDRRCVPLGIYTLRSIGRNHVARCSRGPSKGVRCREAVVGNACHGVAERRRSSCIQTNDVPLDRVRGRAGSVDRDTVVVISRHQIACARRRSANRVRRGAVDIDAIEGIPQIGGAVGAGADVVTLHHGSCR